MVKAEKMAKAKVERERVKAKAIREAKAEKMGKRVMVIKEVKMAKERVKARTRAEKVKALQLRS
jgi:hypothetical protein